MTPDTAAATEQARTVCEGVTTPAISAAAGVLW